MKPLRLAAAAVALVAIAALLTGCSPIVNVVPAANAVDPTCASVIVSLRGVTVAQQPQRETNGQGTAAWGDPSSVILQCGVAPPAPTATLPCVQVGNVFWLRDGTNDPLFVFTTYGREPAISVTVDNNVVAPGVALYDLQAAVAQTKATRQCSSIEDSLGATNGPTPGVTSTPTPTPTSRP